MTANKVYSPSEEEEQRIFSVQRARPFGPIGPRKSIVLPIDQIHPVIRIAHRIGGTMMVPERIIFDHEIILILAGRGIFKLGKDIYDFGPHEILFVPPFVPHRFSSRGSDDEHIAIHFDFAREVPPFDKDLADRAPYQVRLTHMLNLPPQVHLTSGHPVEQAIVDVVRERQSKSPAAAMAAVGLLMQTLAWILRHGATNEDAVSPRNQDRVMRAANYVDENLARPISSADMAAVAGVSSSRLYALFRLVLGISPHEHVIHARVERARSLLADPRLSIKEIAARTGFEDSYHFSRVFRRIDGLPPTQYRDALLRSGQ